MNIILKNDDVFRFIFQILLEYRKYYKWVYDQRFILLENKWRLNSSRRTIYIVVTIARKTI